MTHVKERYSQSLQLFLWAGKISYLSGFQMFWQHALIPHALTLTKLLRRSATSTFK
jgi:hypothetical protein